MRYRGQGESRLPEMEWRKRATEKTFDRYAGKVFDWSCGVTCVHLARCHLRNMEHNPPSMPRFRSALAAQRALEERGWATVADMLDSMLPRIAPSRMMLGDIAVLPGDALDAILICAGPRRLFGWHQDSDVTVMVEPDISQLEAWRV